MPKTILVVEDDLSLQGVIRKKLELQGLIVLSAQSVIEALEIFEDAEVDLVWLDHYLIGQDSGLELVASFKINPRGASIPIIVVSNTGGDEKEREYMEMGVKHFYAKASNRLEDIVRDVLGLLAA